MHRHKAKYRQLRGEVGEAQDRVYRAKAGYVRERPISAPECLQLYKTGNQGSHSIWETWKNTGTRMHSSRMRTVRSSSRLPRGVSDWGVSDRGGSAQKGSVCPGVSVLGGCLPGGTPPVDRMTDACENITLPQLRCGR